MSKVSGKNHTRSQMNNYANQKNPNSREYKANRDNHSNQLNPNNYRFQEKDYLKVETPM